MTKKEKYQRIAKSVMSINHIGVQCDDVHHCENKHQTILALDKLDKYEAIRLLVYVIHVQQLQLCDAEIVYNDNNPFRDMLNFEHIEEHVKCNSTDVDTLY